MDKKTKDTIVQYVIIFTVLCALAYFAYIIGREDGQKDDDNGGEEAPQETSPAGPVSGVAVPVQRQAAPQPQPVYEPTPTIRQNGHVAPVADGSPYRPPSENESLAPLVPESLE